MNLGTLMQFEQSEAYFWAESGFKDLLHFFWMKDLILSG